MVLLREQDGRVFLRSDACIELANALGGGWRALTILGVVPKSLRDLVYHWVARHRQQLMGRTDTCTVPEPHGRKSRR